MKNKIKPTKDISRNLKSTERGFQWLIYGLGIMTGISITIIIYVILEGI